MVGDMIVGGYEPPLSLLLQAIHGISFNHLTTRVHIITVNNHLPLK